MMTAMTQEDAIVREVTIHAPAADIFAALTSPEELLKWWRSEGKFEAVKAECDVRPGGKWRMRMMGGCGSGAESEVHGVYHTVEPPHLLTYTWIREGEDWPETLVRWDLEESRGATTVRVTHTGLTTEAARERNNGWPLVVGLLQAYAERIRPQE
jgi:uncharacterized protein YndB with AHSA1/START domain